MTGATEMRFPPPPKRPPELHDEPEPEYQTNRLGKIYRAIGTGIIVCFILLAVGAFLGTIWKDGTRDEPLRAGMKLEKLK